MRVIKIRPEAWNDLKTWIQESPKVSIRIHRMLDECCRTPLQGIGKPELLKGNLKGRCSRRIDEEHRLIYEVTDTEIIVYSLRGHYD